MYHKKSFFITATNTDVGKSFACEIFLNYYAKKGFKVGYFKPIETGVKNTPLDGEKLFNIAKELNSDFKHLKLSDIVPYQFELPASPYVAKKGEKIDIDFLKAKKEYLLNFCDVLFIEGAGGVLVPIEKELFMIDLITIFNAKAILISPSNLGSINDTLLSQEALKNRDIEFDWYINLYKDKNSFKTISLPFYKDFFQEIKYLHELIKD